MNLGLLNATTAQYALAGWFLVILILFTLAAWWAGRWGAVAIASRFLAEPKSYTSRSVLTYLIGAALAFCFWAGIHAVPKWSGPTDTGRGLLLLAALLLSSYCVGIAFSVPFFRPESGYERQPTQGELRIHRAAGCTIVGLFPILFFFTWVQVYGDGIYRDTVQEFGGMRPRAAYLDVTRAQLSRETREALLVPSDRQASVPDIRSDPMPVVRTVLVDVEFDAGDYLLVRPHGAPVTPTYRLKKEVVQNIAWYGYLLPPEAGNQSLPVAPIARK